MRVMEMPAWATTATYQGSDYAIVVHPADYETARRALGRPPRTVEEYWEGRTLAMERGDR